MHTETVMVYFDDLDAMGVVHNGRYVTLLERAGIQENTVGDSTGKLAEV